jgi:DNA-binding MurR/RpiR family transcriptional regulator
MPNWIVSVTSTPHSPLTEAKKIVMTAQTRSVRSIGQPSTMLPILAAARFTVAMMTQLKNSPR